MTGAEQLGVRVTYRDDRLRPTHTRVYSLAQYTDMLRADLTRLVTDVEDLCYTVNNNRSKEEWTEETFTAFNKIKHKLLDKAGDVERIPENLVVTESESLTDFVAKLASQGG